MARSIKKGPYVNPKLVAKVEKAREKAANKSSRIVIKTWSRRSTIVPQFVGVTMMIHNGKDFISLLVTEDLVGYKLGEFAKTRTFRGHSDDRKTK
ncbi:MAG: 30S ribosomal protein S19 [Gammaproteobacteria bacterium]|nr:30S ribosomal protein S19 [Gammaproteobacteria bacterium]